MLLHASEQQRKNVGSVPFQNRASQAQGGRLLQQRQTLAFLGGWRGRSQGQTPNIMVFSPAPFAAPTPIERGQKQRQTSRRAHKRGVSRDPLWRTQLRGAPLSQAMPCAACDFFGHV